MKLEEDAPRYRTIQVGGQVEGSSMGIEADKNVMDPFTCFHSAEFGTSSMPRCWMSKLTIESSLLIAWVTSILWYVGRYFWLLTDTYTASRRMKSIHI